MGKGILNLGSTIRKLRLSRGMEQNELADLTGITQSHLSKIETGKANPSLDKIKKMAQVLGVDQKTFFSDGVDAASLENDSMVFQHLDKDLRQFISKEGSAPFLEFAKDIHEVGFTQKELDALKLIFLSRRKH